MNRTSFTVRAIRSATSIEPVYLLTRFMPGEMDAPVEPVAPPKPAPDFLSNRVARSVGASKIGRVTASLPVRLAFRPE